MNHIWLVFDGEDNHDCSPTVHSVFSVLRMAKDCAKRIRDAEQARHLKNYSQDGGTHRWKQIESSSTGNEKWRSYITFDASDHDDKNYPDGYSAGIVYIKRMELDLENIRYGPSAS